MFNEKEIIAKWNAEMYDLNETETDDVAFAMSVIGPAPKNVLELACGSGRFLVPLAQAGHTVTGLDSDPYMLEKIGPKARGLKDITWRMADVIRDEWGGGFDVVLIAANFLFNIVSETDYRQAQELLIRKAAKALHPGGSVYIDYAYTLRPEERFNCPGEIVVWEGTDSSGTRGDMALLDNRYDEPGSMACFTRRFRLTLKDGTEIRADVPSEKHFPSLSEVRGWLDGAGFSIEEEYGGYGREPIGEAGGRAIILARKR